MANKKLPIGNPVKNKAVTKQSLEDLAKCGCGIECDCYGYLTLPNWDSSTGERTDNYALFIVDGDYKILPLDDAKAEIQGYKNI